MNTANGIYPVHQSPINPSLDQNGIHPSFGQGFGGPNVNPNNFEVSQFQNQNGQIPNNTSPSIHQSPFQVPSVVPAKRTREEQVGASPHPPASSIGQSRSETPQAPFNQYGGQGARPQFSTQTPFQQHMQQSNHATPSPNPTQQQFRPPSSQPQMSSPSPFPGQGHPGQFPPMSNPMNRIPTPQNPSQHFQSAMQPGQGLHPGAHGGMSGGPSQMGNQFPNMRPGLQPNTGQMPNDLQKQYQASMMRQRQMHGGMNQMPTASQMNGLTPQQRAALMGGMNTNLPGRNNGLPPGTAQVNTQDPATRFMMQLERFAQQKGQPLDPNPTICGRRVHYFHIFSLFMKHKPAHDPQGWASILALLGFPPEQFSSAIPELRALFDRYLSGFVTHYMNDQQRKQSQLARGPGQSSPTNDRVPRPPAPPGFPGQTVQTPGPQAPSPALSNRRGTSTVPDGADVATPEKAGSHLDHSSSPHQFPQGSPVQLKIGPQDDIDGKGQPDGLLQLGTSAPDKDINKPFDPEYRPRRYELNTYGGIDLEPLLESGAAIHEMKTFQRYEELGPVDLHTLSIGLLSGFQEEVRFGLDRIGALSQRPIILRECEDVVDNLVELGQNLVTKLNENTDSLSEGLLFRSYENLQKSCREDLSDLRDQLVFGETSYVSQQRINKLVSITTILRNLSFPFSERPNHERENDINRKILSNPDMQSFWVKIIKLLSVRSSPLCSNADYMDITKDLVVLLSNVSEALIINNEDDARTLLAFLLSFAPESIVDKEGSVQAFASYEPLKHQYLPNALDSLAKILARDDPNRGFLKTIFHNDLMAASRDNSPLITQAFALAIAPIPESVFNAPPTLVLLRLVERRKPTLGQGILVLDLLSTMLPPSTVSTPAGKSKRRCCQRIWLETDDGWASRLIHLVLAMGVQDAQAGPERHPVTQQLIDTGRGYQSITQRALSMVRRVLEGSDRIDLETGVEKAELMSTKILKPVPLREMAFSALMTPRFDSETLKSLTALHQLSSW